MPIGCILPFGVEGTYSGEKMQELLHVSTIVILNARAKDKHINKKKFLSEVIRRPKKCNNVTCDSQIMRVTCQACACNTAYCMIL